MDITWHSRLDRAISSLVRDTLTVVEGSFSDAVQRDAAKQLIKRAIYNSMDALRDDFIRDFGCPPKVN